MEERRCPLPGEGAGDGIVARRPRVGEEAVVGAFVEVEVHRRVLGPEHGFERANLVAHGAMGDEELVGGTREALVARGGFEGAQRVEGGEVAEVHEWVGLRFDVAIGEDQRGLGPPGSNHENRQYSRGENAFFKARPSQRFRWIAC